MNAPLASLELLSARAPEEPLGTIGLPVRDHVNAATMTSILTTDWGFLSGGQMDRLIVQGSILTLQRNECVQKMRGHFLLFIDDDMVWKPQAIGQLVDTFFELDHQFDEPIMVGGLCFRRTPPYQPTLYMRDKPTEGGYHILEKWDTDIVEVDATGMAFVLIPKTALEAIAETDMPPYEERIRMSGLPNFFRWEGKTGEDLRFCQDFKAAGGRIFVDTRIEIGHISEVQIGRHDWLRSLALRQPDEEAQMRTIHDSIGLPTVEAEDAQRQLGWS